jgi:hypothetical protein
MNTERRLPEKEQTKPIDLAEFFTWATPDVLGGLEFNESFGCLQDRGLPPWLKFAFGAVVLMNAQLAIWRLPLIGNLLSLAWPYIASRSVVDGAKELIEQERGEDHKEEGKNPQ